MGVAPALAAGGMPQAAAATAISGSVADGYSQLRAALPETKHKSYIHMPSDKIMVDSHHAPSGTSARFQVRLPETLTLPHHAVCVYDGCRTDARDVDDGYARPWGGV